MRFVQAGLQLLDVLLVLARLVADRTLVGRTFTAALVDACHLKKKKNSSAKKFFKQLLLIVSFLFIQLQIH